MADAFNLKDFTVYHSPATRVHRKGRCKAGLACLIKADPGFNSSLIGSCPPIAIAILLSFSADYHIILINTYLPPVTTESELNDNWSKLSEFTLTTQGQFPTAHLVVMGDFNARIGSSHLDLASSLGIDTEEHLPSLFCCNRSSMDATLNRAGLKLIEYCLAYNLLVLNGLDQFSGSKDFTFCTTRGRSVLDYNLCSLNFFSLVYPLSIDSRTESDHLPLQLSFQVPHTATSDQAQFFTLENAVL